MPAGNFSADGGSLIDDLANKFKLNQIAKDILTGRAPGMTSEQLENLAPGTNVTLSFKSWWNIEWDFDYGFVLVSTDGGTTYTSLASQNGFTTPAAVNPTANACQAQFGNGITGTSGSYGTPPTHPASSPVLFENTEPSTRVGFPSTRTVLAPWSAS